MKKLLFFAGILLVSCKTVQTIKKPNFYKEEICIGDKFLYSHNWISDNPYNKPIVDTVEVLGFKQYYVSYKLKNVELSSETVIFRRNIRQIN